MTDHCMAIRDYIAQQIPQYGPNWDRNDDIVSHMPLHYEFDWTRSFECTLTNSTIQRDVEAMVKKMNRLAYKVTRVHAGVSTGPDNRLRCEVTLVLLGRVR